MTAGTITRRGENSWGLKYEAGERDPSTGKRRTNYETVRGTRRDAQRVLYARLLAVDNGTAVDPSKRTVAEQCRDWLDRVESALAYKTVRRYRALVEQQIIPHLGSIALQKLRPADIEDWHAALRARGGEKGRPLSPRTVGHAHRVLHVCLQDANRREAVARNVAGLVHPPKVDTAEIAILGAGDVGKVIAGLAGDRLQAIALVAFGCGLRRGEICGLAWGDIDLTAGALQVERSLERRGGQGLHTKAPKSHNGKRTMTLPAATLAAIREHWRVQQEERLRIGLGRATDDDLVFTLEDGSPYDPDYLSRRWRRTLNAKSLPYIPLKGSRHTHASALIAGGVDPLMISRRMGHATPAFTMSVYGHLFRDRDDAAAVVLDAVLPAPTAAAGE